MSEIEVTTAPAAVAAPETAEAAAAAPSGECHPLHCRWTVSYNGPSKNKTNWEENVKTVMHLETVEDFWGLFNNIPRVDELAPSSDYNLFREGIFPGWEDAANREGGKWLVAVGGNDLSTLSRMWMDSCMFAIGEQFVDTQEICGIVVSVRARGNKLCLWTRTAVDEEKTKALGRKWKAALGLKADQAIKYQFHSESLQTQRSFPKGDAYTV
ncbi:eukaryotic translation initiation factor 4E [Blastocladiella emersonii ATCC 22665]|nr:eukaryotic translation initiation factor 4E [Blastocladiella emersonii ATCC 22665]